MSMKGNVLTVVLVAGKILGLDEKTMKYYSNEKLKNQEKYLDSKNTQKMSDKEEENWVDLKTLKKIPDYWKREYIKSPSEFNAKCWLVSALYVTANYMPPVRGNVFIKMRYYNEDPKEKGMNYFVNGENKYFVFGDHKTIKANGKQVTRIPKNSKILGALRAYRKYNDTDYFLLNDNEEPFAQVQFTRFLYRVFEKTGKKVSSTMLRKIFISDYFKSDKSKLNRQKLAKKMLHSVGVQALVYEKK